MCNVFTLIFVYGVAIYRLGQMLSETTITVTEVGWSKQEGFVLLNVNQ